MSFLLKRGMELSFVSNFLVQKVSTEVKLFMEARDMYNSCLHIEPPISLYNELCELVWPTQKF